MTTYTVHAEVTNDEGDLVECSIIYQGKSLHGGLFALRQTRTLEVDSPLGYAGEAYTLHNDPAHVALLLAVYNSREFVTGLFENRYLNITCTKSSAGRICDWMDNAA